MTRKKKSMISTEKAAGIILATLGCNSGCAADMDPAPSPLVCNDSVQSGSTLEASGYLDGSVLTVIIQEGSDVEGAVWEDVRILNMENLTLVDSHHMYYDQITLSFEVIDASVTTGTFTLLARMGNYVNSDDSRCEIRRTFTVDMANGVVEIASVDFDPLPLASRNRTIIVMNGQTSGSVDLEAKMIFPKTCEFSWSVSHGTLLSSNGCRARWKLPEEKGFYQAQVVSDFGAQGLSFDAITVEVV